MRGVAAFCCWFLLVSAASAQTPDVSTKVLDKRSAPREVPNLAKRMDGVDWPFFLGPTHDGKSPETGIRKNWKAEPLPIVWQRRLATSYCMPAICRGRLILFERVGNQMQVACLHSENGQPIWQFRYPTDYEDMYGYDNGPRCAPVVDDDRVYVYGAEGMLYCLDVLEGHEIWRVNTVRDFGVIQGFFGVGCTPLVEGDLLIVIVGGSPPGSAAVPIQALEGNGSGVVAFDKYTGQVKYRISNELASYASPVAATIDGRRWCFAFMRGGLLGFEPASGNMDFHYPWRAPILECVNASNPVIDGNQVLISETYGPGASLLQVKPGGYDVVWADPERSRRKSLATHWNTPVLHEGVVYASSGRHTSEAELRAVEFKTGKVLWSEPGLARASLLYVDGHFVCLCEYGELLLLKANPEKFELVTGVVMNDPDAKGPEVPGIGAPRLLEYPAWAAPILSHGLLYVRGRDRLVCLELIPPRS